MTDRPLLVLGVGGFGEQVAQLLTVGAGAARRVEPAGLAEAFASRPAAVVLAAQHPVPALCERADVLAWQYEVPWLPVVAEDQVVRVGPWVVPGQGPCFNCYLARRIQHDDQSSITQALWQVYEADAGSGPRGFLPQHTRSAAGLVQSLFGRSDGRPDGATVTPGSVTALSLLNGEVDTHPVLRCHGCRRCAPETVPGVDRTGALAQLVGTGATHQLVGTGATHQLAGTGATHQLVGTSTTQQGVPA